MFGVSPSVLLLTATVAPDPAMPVLRVRDPASRRREYERAFAFYLGLPPELVSGIVLAENSGADLTPFAEIAARRGMADRVELLPVSAAPPALGRGVGEAHIIDEAMGGSVLLRAAGPDQGIWKVTGRYMVCNLRRLIARRPATDLYVNLRRRPQTWCVTYAYAFTRRGYERYLADATERFRPSAEVDLVTEYAMGRYVEELLGRGEPIVPRFAAEPRLDGVRAWDQESYRSPRQRLKYLARVSARRTLPGLWV